MSASSAPMPAAAGTTMDDIRKFSLDRPPPGAFCPADGNTIVFQPACPCHDTAKRRCDGHHRSIKVWGRGNTLARGRPGCPLKHRGDLLLIITSTCALVEVGVDEFRHRLGDAVDRLQILDAGHRHRLGGAEMAQQRPLARRADAGDLVERICVDLLGALGPVGADGEPVRLVAQALDELQHLSRRPSNPALKITMPKQLRRHLMIRNSS